MKKIIEKNPGFCILAGALLGLITPGISSTPSWFILVIVASVIYLSCFNIQLNDYKSLSAGDIGLFVLFRFILLPFLAFYLLNSFNSTIAVSICLLFLMPAGVSSPALSSIYNGNVSLGLIMCLLTHLITPLTIPLVCKFTVGKNLNLDIFDLFMTVFITVLAPFLFYLLTRNIKSFLVFFETF